MRKKFICDGALGRLCKLLRMCGIDTLYSNQGMIILLEARKEDRIILTKNTRLQGRDGVFFLMESAPAEQLKCIIDEFKVNKEINLFSRCIECNDTLVVVEKKMVKDKVPYFTYKYFDEFTICPTCQRIYWKGSHYKNMVSEIGEILGK